MTNKPNWKVMIDFLLEHYTQKQIEIETGLDQSTISRIKNQRPYKSPIYENGANLIKMYEFAKYQEERK